jgi:hypothetical protein
VPALRALDLRAELFLRAGPRLAAVFVDVRLTVLRLVLRLPALRAPFFRAVFTALLRVALRTALRTVLRVDFRALLRAGAFRAADLRVVPDVFDFDLRFAPVREPAARLELLRDDFLVAMLYSDTV